jgi:hypothetical protein
MVLDRPAGGRRLGAEYRQGVELALQRKKSTGRRQHVKERSGERSELAGAVPVTGRNGARSIRLGVGLTDMCGLDGKFSFKESVRLSYRIIKSYIFTKV